MLDRWSEIRKLQGRTLYTLDQHKPFDVVAVGEDDVIVRPHVNRVERRIERWKIEGACEELMTVGQMTRSRIREGYTEYHPAYVAALLAELPGIRCELKPITLYSGTTYAKKHFP